MSRNVALLRTESLDADCRQQIQREGNTQDDAYQSPVGHAEGDRARRDENGSSPDR
ncbi:hypothetical protein [Halovenus sp. HT40]|uniref:hypothetical protein n=1 Tax=Halovenus sp. HT40 TaxID=3126691 RepID=UPI00300F6A45